MLVKLLRSPAFLAAVAAAAVCAVGASAAPGPAQDAAPQYLYGTGLVRARVIVLAGGVLHEYNVDRGQIRTLAGGAVTLKERDGLSNPIPVAPTARIQVDRRVTTYVGLKRGMTAVVVRDGTAPAEAVVASKQLPPTGWLAGTYFGSSMVRLEAYVQRNGGAHDYRLDRGRIRAIAPGTLTLRERDGQFFDIPVATAAKVKLNGRAAGFGALRRGMSVSTLRDNDDPASLVQAFTR